MIAQAMAGENPPRVLSLTSIMSATGKPGMPSAEPDAMKTMMQPTPDPASDEAGSRQVERGAAPTAETRIVPATGSAGRLKLADCGSSASGKEAGKADVACRFRPLWSRLILSISLDQSQPVRSPETSL
jgi:hypothetical protein